MSDIIRHDSSSLAVPGYTLTNYLKMAEVAKSALQLSGDLLQSREQWEVDLDLEDLELDLQELELDTDLTDLGL